MSLRNNSTYLRAKGGRSGVTSVSPDAPAGIRLAAADSGGGTAVDQMWKWSVNSGEREAGTLTASAARPSASFPSSGVTLGPSGVSERV